MICGPVLQSMAFHFSSVFDDFYMVLFSALKQSHFDFVACDSK